MGPGQKLLACPVYDISLTTRVKCFCQRMYALNTLGDARFMFSESMLFWVRKVLDMTVNVGMDTSFKSFWHNGQKWDTSMIANYIFSTRFKNRARFESFHFSEKAPLVNDLLKINVTESITSNENSFRSLVVIPSGQGLFDGSKFSKMDFTSETETATVKILWIGTTG